MNQFLSLATLLVISLTITAHPVDLILKDATCQDGGNAACWTYCKATGHSSGHCVGTEPNENCVCTDSLGTKDATCQDGGNAACWTYCKATGHSSGHCVGSEPNENCVCTDNKLKSEGTYDPVEHNVTCSDTDCLLQCVQEGCKTGKCSGDPNRPCECLDCPETVKSKGECWITACQIQCHGKGFKNAECVPYENGTECQCSNSFADE